MKSTANYTESRKSHNIIHLFSYISILQKNQLGLKVPTGEKNYVG